MTLFIGCSDFENRPLSADRRRPGRAVSSRNVGALYRRMTSRKGFHGTAAAIEFAVLNLNVKRIVVCSHTHCSAPSVPYNGEVPREAQNWRCGWSLVARPRCRWLSPVPRCCDEPSSVRWSCSFERLMDYPMVRRVEAGSPDTSWLALRYRGRRDSCVRRSAGWVCAGVKVRNTLAQDRT